MNDKAATADDALTILLIGNDEVVGGDDPLADEIANALDGQGALVEQAARNEAQQAVFVHAPDIVVLFGDALADGGDDVLSQLAAKSATAVVPVILLRGDRTHRVPRGFGNTTIATLERGEPTTVARRIVDLANQLCATDPSTTRIGARALRALLASGRSPSRSGARVIVPTTRATHEEEMETVEVATPPQLVGKPVRDDRPTPAVLSRPIELTQRRTPVPSEAPKPSKASALRPSVPTARYGAVSPVVEMDPPFVDPIDVARVPSRQHGALRVVTEAPARRRAVARAMAITKPIEPATSTRPTEVDLRVVSPGARGVPTMRLERVPDRSRLFVVGAVVLALVIVGAATLAHQLAATPALVATQVAAASPLEAVLDRGDAARRDHDLASAQASYHAALEDDATNARALAGLARLYAQQGSRDLAARYARRLVESHPDQPSSAVLLGDVLRANGDLAGARGAYESALAVSASYGPALERLESLAAD